MTKLKIKFWLPVVGAQTAWDMLHEEQLLPRITTSCADLDNILGGGINCKEVTEIGWLLFSYLLFLLVLKCFLFKGLISIF